MKKIYFLIFACVAMIGIGITAFSMTAPGRSAFSKSAEEVIQASAKAGSIHKECPGVKTIDVSTGISVMYIQVEGEPNYILNAPENVLPVISVTIKGETMYVKVTKPIQLRADQEVTMVLYAPVLEEADLSGSAKFETHKLSNPAGKFELDCSGCSDIKIYNLEVAKLNIDLSGASQISGKAVKASKLAFDFSGASEGKMERVDAGKLTVDLSGASQLSLGGRAAEVVYEASGASSLKAKGLKARKGSAEASGASSIQASIEKVTLQETSGMSSIKIAN